MCPKSTCNKCYLKTQCTRSKTGRTLKRHIRQDDLDSMLNQAKSAPSKEDIRTRQHLMERSFAHAVRYGFKRSRWRRLWRVQIQEYLTAAIQNIKTLISKKRRPRTALEEKVVVKNSCRSIKAICDRPLGLFSKTLMSLGPQFYAEMRPHLSRFVVIF